MDVSSVAASLHDSPIRRGRHRAPSRWSRHHPEHEDPQRGIVSLLVPSWKLARELERDRSTRPGTHRARVVIDDRSGPEWDVGNPPSPAIEVIREEHEVSFEDVTTPSHEDPVIMTPQGPAPSSAPVRQGPPPPTIVDRSQVLPPAEPEESSSLASLFGFGERQVSFETTWAEDDTGDTAWDSLPSLSDVAVDGEQYRTTGTTIQRLWDATEHHPIVMDAINVATEELPARLTDSRRFRRSVLVGAVVALLVAGWAIREISAQPEQAAIAREVQYSTAASQINEAVSPIERSIALVAAPGMGASHFSQLTGELDVLDGIARSAGGLATEPLPRAPIVGSSLPIDALILPKRLLEQASLQALNLAQRIGDAVSYRLTFANTFDLPPLPDQATLAEIGTIGGGLNVALAETEQMLEQLPDDAFFARHRQEAFDLIASLEVIQADIALRNDDAGQAAQIREAMLRSIVQLRDALDEPLAAAEAWAHTQIAQLRDVIAEIQDLVGE